MPSTTERRAALEGLVRILDAGSPEELLTGPEVEASFLFTLLTDAARGRSSSHYAEICRTARRRGVTAEYVIDRAAILLSTIAERRRTDLYRILGVPPLASAEIIRRRWLEVARAHHPDVGGDAARFRRAKQAYDVLRDGDRRGEYEQFWLQAHGPFERVASEEPPPAEATVPVLDSALTEALDAATRVLAAGATLDRRVRPGAVAPGLGGFVDAVGAVLAALDRGELERLADEANAAARRLEPLQRQLAVLAEVRRRLAKDRPDG